MSEDNNGAPEPKQLSKEEEIAHARAVISQLTLQREKEMEGILENIREKGFGNHVYDTDSKVEISGHLFAQLLNFSALLRDHGDDLRMMLADVVYNQDSITLGALDFQTALAKMHISNCEAGIAKVVATEKPVENKPTKPAVRKSKATPKNVTRKNK